MRRVTDNYKKTILQTHKEEVHYLCLIFYWKPILQIFAQKYRRVNEIDITKTYGRLGIDYATTDADGTLFTNQQDYTLGLIRNNEEMTFPIPDKVEIKGSPININTLNFRPHEFVGAIQTSMKEPMILKLRVSNRDEFFINELKQIYFELYDGITQNDKKRIPLLPFEDWLRFAMVRLVLFNRYKEIDWITSPQYIEGIITIDYEKVEFNLSLGRIMDALVPFKTLNPYLSPSLSDTKEDFKYPCR